jgi:hypothetical protein
MSRVSFTETTRRGLAIATGCSVAVLVPLVLCAPTAAAQAPPPTLTGESLAAGLFTAPAGLGSIAITSATCKPAASSSFSYQVSGPAAGPYPGTFTESGTVTMGPQNITTGFSNPTALITAWTVSFTITSPAGSVTGTKTLPTGATGVGICTTASQSPVGVEQYAANVVPPGLAYRAAISVSGAQFGDHGLSFPVTFNDVPATAASNNFNEGFTSEQVTTMQLCNQNSQANQDQVLNQQGCTNSQ